MYPSARFHITHMHSISSPLQLLLLITMKVCVVSHGQLELWPLVCLLQLRYSSITYLHCFVSKKRKFTLKTDFEIWVFMQFTETVVLGWVHVLQIQKMEMLGSKLKHNCLSFSNTILSKPNATSEVCRDFSSFVPQCTKNKKKFALAL